jgi:hypothetical protein
MKVVELIAKLSKFPADTPVLMASDGEGNSFDGLHAVESGRWDERRREVTAPDDGEDARGVKCVVLWP